jgi:hypothetical protein
MKGWGILAWWFMTAEYGGGNSRQSFAGRLGRRTAQLAGFQLATGKTETLSAVWRKFPEFGENRRKFRFARAVITGHGCEG